MARPVVEQKVPAGGRLGFRAEIYSWDPHHESRRWATHMRLTFLSILNFENLWLGKWRANRWYRQERVFALRKSGRLSKTNTYIHWFPVRREVIWNPFQTGSRWPTSTPHRFEQNLYSPSVRFEASMKGTRFVFLGCFVAILMQTSKAATSTFLAIVFHLP